MLTHGAMPKSKILYPYTPLRKQYSPGFNGAFDAISVGDTACGTYKQLVQSHLHLVSHRIPRTSNSSH